MLAPAAALVNIWPHMNLGTVSPVFSSTKQMVVPNDVVGELSLALIGNASGRKPSVILDVDPRHFR